ncbi:hypothetical protein MRB53_041077 [Persea americana]|nr:hypothetical protein MRB53_041077 [Persea americana]
MLDIQPHDRKWKSWQKRNMIGRRAKCIDFQKNDSADEAMIDCDWTRSEGGGQRGCEVCRCVVAYRQTYVSVRQCARSSVLPWRFLYRAQEHSESISFLIVPRTSRNAALGRGQDVRDLYSKALDAARRDILQFLRCPRRIETDGQPHDPLQTRYKTSGNEVGVFTGGLNLSLAQEERTIHASPVPASR